MVKRAPPPNVIPSGFEANLDAFVDWYEETGEPEFIRRALEWAHSAASSFQVGIASIKDA